MLNILNDDELKTLTGYRRPAYQARWLAANGIPFWLRKDGRPVVARQAVERPSEAPARQRPREEPCLDGLASGGGA